jgi:predicted nucleic acid-binding Zn ribbon protein
VKAHIAQRKKEGLCMVCGKPAYDGHTLCMEHYLEFRRKSHERYEKKMQEKRDHDAQRAAELRDVYHVEKCLYCDNYTIPGKKLCSKHYKLACKNIAKAKRASIKKRKEARNAAKKVGKRKGGK